MEHPSDGVLENKEQEVSEIIQDIADTEAQDIASGINEVIIKRVRRSLIKLLQEADEEDKQEKKVEDNMGKRKQPVKRRVKEIVPRKRGRKSTNSCTTKKIKVEKEVKKGKK